jgi:hypothetical protein
VFIDVSRKSAVFDSIVTSIVLALQSRNIENALS